MKKLFFSGTLWTIVSCFGRGESEHWTGLLMTVWTCYFRKHVYSSYGNMKGKLGTHFTWV